MDAKKNVTLEIRLADRTKTAFMERCRRQDRTASEAVRVFIEGELAPNPTPHRRSCGRVALAWVVGMALGAGVAVPSLARPERSVAPSFVQLDLNRDGVLSVAEFRRR